MLRRYNRNSSTRKLINIIQFQRNVRTRPPTKVELLKTESVNTKQANVVPDTKPNERTSGKISSRSKFAPGNMKFSNDSSTNKLLTDLKFKDEDVIKNELMTKFKQDGMEMDDSFVSKMIEESQKEKKILKDYIDNPDKKTNELDIEEINKFIDWLIEDGNERIRYQKQDEYKKKMDLRNKINKFVAQKDEVSIEDELELAGPDPNELKDAFSNAQELAFIKSESSLDQLPHFLKHLSKINNSDLQNLVLLDKFAALFELSTQILDTNKRDLCIYRCGKMLYNALFRELGPRARPDPINEKFFIESCVKFDDLDHALALFNSRKDKDVKDERFWFELGATIHLSKYSKDIVLTEIDGNNQNLVDAKAMIEFIRNKWGFVSNLLLIDGVKRCCLSGDYTNAWWFWEQVEYNIENYGGIVEEIVVPKTELLDESEKSKVFQYYNRIEPISHLGLTEIVFAFISKLQFEKGLLVLNRIVEVDTDFMYEFLEELKNQFKYSGRELLLINLEDDARKKDNEAIYEPEIRDYLIEEIKPLQPTRCSSYEEAKIIEEMNIFFERLSLLNEKSLKTRDMKELIQSGEKITPFDIRTILSILLNRNSTTSFELALKIVTQMNDHKLNDVTESILPISDSDTYYEFFRKLLSQKNPRINEINSFLSMMTELNIEMNQKLANLIISSYTSRKLYSESMNFVEKYLFTDHPIAVRHISLKGKRSEFENLWVSSLMAYYKPLIHGLIPPELYQAKLESLRRLIECLMTEKVNDSYTIQQAVGSLIAYGDYQGTLCMLQWYGQKSEDQTLDFDFVYALKSKLESSIIKAGNRLSKTNNQNHSYTARVQEYRKLFGIQSMKQHVNSDTGIPWQEVATDVYKYAEIFGFSSFYRIEDPFSVVISDMERFKNKNEFILGLYNLETRYGLGHWEVK